MSEFNSAHNRIVWCDIPVADLDRASAFYRGVLAIKVERVEFDGMVFAIFEHEQGNGVCLIPRSGYAGCDNGPLLYMNVDRRIRDAVDQVTTLGGKVIEKTHAIGPHGFRAIIEDSEHNRIALHSTSEA